MMGVSQELLDVVPRIGVALVCGVGIGVNRDLHHKPAGFRTFGLVAVGSAVITLVALSLAPADPAAVSRIAQGILTGIGFLGAGLIVRRERSQRVSGLTTAAAVWATAGLGVACGLGLYLLAVSALVVMLLVLVLGGPIERRLERMVDVSPDDAARPGGQRAD